jgi:hypothetical protein
MASSDSQMTPPPIPERDGYEVPVKIPRPRTSNAGRASFVKEAAELGGWKTRSHWQTLNVFFNIFQGLLLQIS